MPLSLTRLLSYTLAHNPKIASILSFFCVVIKHRPDIFFPEYDLTDMFTFICYLYTLTGPDNKKLRIVSIPKGMRKLSAITFWLNRISDSPGRQYPASITDQEQPASSLSLSTLRLVFLAYVFLLHTWLHLTDVALVCNADRICLFAQWHSKRQITDFVGRKKTWISTSNQIL